MRATTAHDRSAHVASRYPKSPGVQNGKSTFSRKTPSAYGAVDPGGSSGLLRGWAGADAPANTAPTSRRKSEMGSNPSGAYVRLRLSNLHSGPSRTGWAISGSPAAKRGTAPPTFASTATTDTPTAEQNGRSATGSWNRMIRSSGGSSGLAGSGPCTA